MDALSHLSSVVLGCTLGPVRHLAPRPNSHIALGKRGDRMSTSRLATTALDPDSVVEARLNSFRHFSSDTEESQQGGTDDTTSSRSNENEGSVLSTTSLMLVSETLTHGIPVKVDSRYRSVKTSSESNQIEETCDRSSHLNGNFRHESSIRKARARLEAPASH